MLQFLRRYWPSTLRVRLMLILLPVVGLPIIATGYILKLRGQEILIEEKRQHLQGINALLDQYLKKQGGYSGLLASYPGKPDDRQAKIRYLNSRLRAYTDEVARAFPDVGVGYFNLELKAMVTYGPSVEYHRMVGLPIPEDHPGWKVMSSGTAMTANGKLVRGDIMNAMLPIKEGSRVTGYIWANEFTDAIERQSSAMHVEVYSMTLAGFGLSLAVVFFVISQLTNSMKKIKQGLVRLSFDLREPIPPIQGEIGEIVNAINELAKTLLETSSIHHNILDSLSDAVITVDTANKISYINPAACTLFRCEACEAIGAPYPSLFENNLNCSGLIEDTLQNGNEHRDIELDYFLPEHTAHLLASTSLLFDGRGHPLGVVAIIRDISETLSLRNQVARADRLAAIGEMAASIAHEMRTPLTSIRGFVQYLQSSTDPQEWHEYGRIIIREVDGLNRIVSELLDLVRSRPLHIEPTDINQLIEQTLLLARDGASSQRINFILELDEPLPLLQVDQGQIKQVLLNIIVNAIQSITGRGEIRISTTAYGSNGIRLRVSDTGCGIPAAVRERIFDPFFSTKPSGTGLGMAIARRIIENHHGKIEIESVEGLGSSVTLILYASPEENVP